MPKLSIEAGKYTDPGPRKNNEDAVWIPEPGQKPAPTPEKGHLYVVCDGVGGHAAGEKASRLAVKLIPEYYYQDSGPNIRQSFRQAIERANQRIYQDALENDDYRGMACTLTAAIVKGEESLVANVGDSRVYLIRGGAATQITRDHSWVEEQVRARILTPEEARTHRRKNVVTRSMGVQPEVDIDFFGPSTVKAGDTLILCTDGLTGVVGKADLEATVKQNLSAEETARQLVELALEKKTKDNVTCAVAHLGKRSGAAVAPIAAGGKKSGSKTPLLLGGVIIVGLIVATLLFFVLSALRSEDSSSEVATQAPPSSAEAAAVAAATQTLAPVAAAPTRPASGPREAPALAAPLGNAFAPNAPISFEWSAVPLEPGETFAVNISKDGRLIDLPKVKTIEPHLGIPPGTLEPGEYNWFVSILDELRVRYFYHQIARAPAGDAPYKPAGNVH